MAVKYYERKVLNEALDRLNTDEILVFVGARQAGKTTILRKIKEYLDSEGLRTFFINLEDIDYLELLNQSPKNLFKLIPLKEEKKIYILIDEVQYLDNPTNFLKFIYDEYAYSIKLIVSGSSAFYIDKKFKDSLAGRKKVFHVNTLSLDEMLLFKGRDDLRKIFLDTVNRDNLSISHLTVPVRRELIKYIDEYMVYGGYPKVVLEDEDRKAEALEELAYSYIKKDVLESRVRHTDKFYVMLKVISAQIGGLLNINELSRTIRLSTTAVEHSVYIMKKSFHIVTVPPLYRNMRKELTKMHKVYFHDLGLRNFFVKNFQPVDIRQDVGQLYENFVYRLLIDQWGAENIRFWRTQTGQEVDFIVDGKIAYEVKFNGNNFRPSKYTAFMDNYRDIKFHLIYRKGEIKPAIKDSIGFMQI